MSFALGVLVGVGYSLFVLIVAQICGAGERAAERFEKERESA